MVDLKERFEEADRIPAPDLWQPIQRKVAAREPSSALRVVRSSTIVPARHRATARKLLTIAAALLVAAVAFGLIVRAFRSTSVPAAAPGGHLAYEAKDRNGNLHLFLANADGSDTRPLLPYSAVEQPKWSPDGAHLSVAVNGIQVVGGLVDADGAGFHAFSPPDATLNAACVFWSPDGARLACEAWDGEHPDRHGIYTVRASDGQDLRRMTTGLDTPCAWSPDGTRLAFLRHQPGDGPDRFGLMVVGADGTGPSRLGPAGVALACDWSPDGRTILTERHGSLFLVGLDGSMSKIRIGSSGGSARTWASGASFSPDGTRIVFSFDRGDGQTDLYTMRVDGSDLRQVTDTVGDDEWVADWGP